MNLYFMMKLILSDKIDKISKIDYPDLLDVKKYFKILVNSLYSITKSLLILVQNFLFRS